MLFFINPVNSYHDVRLVQDGVNGLEITTLNESDRPNGENNISINNGEGIISAEVDKGEKSGFYASYYNRGSASGMTMLSSSVVKESVSGV